MKTLHIEGSWKAYKGKLKQKLADLINNETLYNEGKKEEMLGRILVKLGRTKQELFNI
jgi:uncharacterized protein YjbJ (UPF0337 family)